jgi:DNA-binding CsgD family transcriptional regulator/tetratricopeptide (TPR) repeat protein
MLTTVVSSGRSKFDNAAFEIALRAADYERCGLLVAGSDTPESIIASSLLALRERRYVDVIGLLSDFPQDPRERRLSRDVLLGAALALTRDFVGGRRLIDRALVDLQPGQPFYEDAVYYRSVIAWMQHDYPTAEKETLPQLKSKDANNRARAHVLLSWIALRRAEVLRQVDELQKALDELDLAERPDQYYRANALFTLALLCRELPLGEVAERVRGIYDTLPWTSGLTLERFQVTRFLAAINELSGNELAAFAGFKAAARLAPSEHWSVLCLTDRALLARNTGEIAFAAELLQEAHELAQRLSWNVSGEERSALLVLAELFSDEDPGIAEQYLARFRSLTASVIPLLSYGTDPRIRGLELYSQGLAWLRLGDVGEGKAALSEAWAIYEDFDYGWRAALCALHLYETTRDRRWLQRAARKIASWPDSWIARRITEVTNASCASLELVPPAKRDVLELVRAGRRNSEIASVLGRSPNTIRNQISQLFQTFNVKSRAELVSILAKQSTVTRLRPRTAKA